MHKILISACLLGQHVRYDGHHSLTSNDILDTWRARGLIVPFCPEVAGGLSTPRPPAEIQHGNGRDVLEGRAFLRTAEGTDVTRAFILGAQKALALARQEGVKAAVLKARSPSCANKEIYDGTFSRTRITGQGVTAALFKREGIPVFDEDELHQAAAYLEDLEARLQALADHCVDTIAVVSEEGRFLYLSSSARTVLGLDPAMSEHPTLFELLTPDSAHTLRNRFMHQLLVPEEIGSWDLLLRHHQRHLTIKSRNLLSDPGIGGLLLNIRDVTELKSSE